MPSINPTIVLFTPRILVRNNGMSGYIISLDTSMKKLTQPRVKTLRSRPRNFLLLLSIGLSQRLKIRHKGKGKDFVLKLPFFNLCKYHNGLVPFIQRTVSLDDGRTHDSATEVLYLFKVECFYKHGGLCEAFYLGRDFFILVNPHLQPVIGDSLCLRLQMQQIFSACLLYLFSIVFSGIIQLQDIGIVEDPADNRLKTCRSDGLAHVRYIKPHVVSDS